MLQPDGTTYVFGNTVYNTKKVEATFYVSDKPLSDEFPELVQYNGSTQGGGDNYLNKITTPGYAHTYMISSVLSADYEDIDNNGPSDLDLGTYTKFGYTTINDYKWRTPFQQDLASYNEGLKTNKKDQKGTYIYGEKQVSYLNKIETNKVFPANTFKF